VTDLLIRNCDVLRYSPDRTWTDMKQDILVDGARITAIQPASEEAPDAKRAIDGSGMLAIPGLVNTHAHVPMVLFRGMVEDVTINDWFNTHIWPMEANLTPEDVYWGALLGIAEMIQSGVTCVADHYFAMDEVGRAVTESGMRANLTWAMFGHEGSQKIDQTSQFIQNWNGKGDGRITAWLGPHAPYTCDADFLRLCAVRAAELGVGIHIHVSETEEQVAASLQEHGMTPVQMLAETGILDRPTLLAHCAYPTDQEDIAVGRQAHRGSAFAQNLS
jgi:5-methylthioadenosine/S-adenosylhomocysteine deaminase